jgi:membrane protease subunit HflK
MKSAGIGLGLMSVVVALIWLGSGFFIVQEGQQAVITTFGKYSRTVDAGFQWRMPFPVESHEIVAVTQLQSIEVGRNTVVQATGLRDSSMLTQDENIVDIRFTVQYRRSDARAPFREPQSRRGRGAGHGIGGARDRRPQQGRLGAVRTARRHSG